MGKPAASAVTYSRAALLRLATHRDEAVCRWAVGRLSGDGDTLLPLVSDSHGEAAHAAFHALLDTCWDAGADAVRTAWNTVSGQWRPAVAAMAARCGWGEAARSWAQEIGRVPDREWRVSAHMLLHLDPELLVGKVVEHAPPADAADWERDAPWALLTAGTPDVLRRLVLMIFSGVPEVARLLGEWLLVEDSVAWIAGVVLGGVVDRARSARGAAVPPAGLRAAFPEWTASVPAPWGIRGCDPRGRVTLADCRTALVALADHLPAPSPVRFSAPAAYLDGRRRECLEMMAVAAKEWGRDSAGGSATGDGWTMVWALGVALYAAVCHPVDWWAWLDGSSAAVEGSGGEGATADAWRTLGLLRPVHGDPPPFFVHGAAARGAAMADACLRLMPARAEAVGEGMGVLVPGGGAGDGVVPILPPPVLAREVARVARSALHRYGSGLPDRYAAPLLDAVEALAGGVDTADLCALARFLGPGAVDVYVPALADPRPSRRLAAAWLLAEMPWAGAGRALAERVPALARDGRAWPDAGYCAADTGSPAALEALLSLWRAGDYELGEDLSRMAAVADASGWPVPAGLDRVCRDLAGRGARERRHEHGSAEHGSDGDEEPAWPLRVAMRCEGCGRVHIYDVQRLNLCPEEAPGTGAGGLHRHRHGFEWIATPLDISRHVVPAPRFACRSCGSAGPWSFAQRGVGTVQRALVAWDADQAAMRSGETPVSHGAAASRSGGRAGGATATSRWADRVQWVDPIDPPRRSMGAAQAVATATAAVANGRAEVPDLVFLAEIWARFGDAAAARAYAGMAAARDPGAAATALALARVAEAEGDTRTAIAQWRRAVSLASGPGGDRQQVLPVARAALARVASRGNGQAVRRPVGRNDPCPCGSGLKYKKCCGR